MGKPCTIPLNHHRREIPNIHSGSFFLVYFSNKKEVRNHCPGISAKTEESLQRACKGILKQHENKSLPRGRIKFAAETS